MAAGLVQLLRASAASFSCCGFCRIRLCRQPMHGAADHDGFIHAFQLLKTPQNCGPINPTRAGCLTQDSRKHVGGVNIRCVGMKAFSDPPPIYQEGGAWRAVHSHEGMLSLQYSLSLNANISNGNPYSARLEFARAPVGGT